MRALFILAAAPTLVACDHSRIAGTPSAPDMRRYREIVGQ